MIDLAHNCARLGIPFDSRLFTEPPGNYSLGLQLVVERVSDANRAEMARAEAGR